MVLEMKDKDFYLEIWKEREHICESCGVHLSSEPLTIYFDHLLEKSKYPELRHEKANILLVCLECHDKKTRGFPTQKHQQKINLVKSLIEKK